MKKDYMKPSMRIVELRHKVHILAGSGDSFRMSVHSEEVDAEESL